MAKKISQEEFENRLQERFPKEKFKIIEYTAMSNPLKIQCLSCNKILYNPQAKNFLAKNKKAGCSDCNGLRAKNTKNLITLQEKYDILDQNRDELGKMWYTCKCKMCGQIATHNLTHFLTSKCRCEGKGAHWTEKEFKQRLFEERGNEYILVTPFITVDDKALFKHSCGFTWSITPAHILYNKTNCPKCCRKDSKGCKVIEAQLNKLSIQYEREKFLENSLQRFDFYCIYNNQEYAIEYNGEQHYKYNPFFHGRDISVFQKYQERDSRKKQYCVEHNIKLIIIPYTMTHEEIKNYINTIFNSSTTNSMNVAASAAK